MRRKFYNIAIDLYQENDLLEKLKNVLKGNRAMSVFFVNAHCFNIAQKNELYRRSLLNSDFVLNDGIGIKIAGKLNGTIFPANLNGTDLIPKIIDCACSVNSKVYVLGSVQNNLEKAVENLLLNYPSIQIAGYRNGYYSSEQEESVALEINNSGAELLIVGMGVPRQELFIFNNLSRLTNLKLCVAGGAIIDFMSGETKRAPRWIRTLNLEWAFRLLLEPGRMWKRYIIGNVLFFINLYRSRHYKK